MGDVIMAVRAGRRARLHEKKAGVSPALVRRAITALPPRSLSPLGPCRKSCRCRAGGNSARLYFFLLFLLLLLGRHGDDLHLTDLSKIRCQAPHKAIAPDHVHLIPEWSASGNNYIQEMLYFSET
jgi:hypothetical protein